MNQEVGDCSARRIFKMISRNGYIFFCRSKKRRKKWAAENVTCEIDWGPKLKFCKNRHNEANEIDLTNKQGKG